MNASANVHQICSTKQTLLVHMNVAQDLIAVKLV